jgi:RNA polymerase sigma-70 factor, ECF subfamily
MGLGDVTLAARAEDVFIVAAVLDRVPNADVRFEEQLKLAVRGAGRIDHEPSFLDEVQQELRVTLLTGAHPKLATYLAAGALLDWLRVVAVRLALNLKRKAHLPPADAFAEPQDQDHNHDAESIGRFYVEDLQRALELGFGQLSARERTLLRLHFVDGLNIDRIGTIYSVHRATIARWLVSIRRRLFVEAKAHLAGKHGLDTTDVRSLYRLMERDVHISVSRILAG